MKKILITLIICALALCIAGCGQNGTTATADPVDGTESQTAAAELPTAPEPEWALVDSDILLRSDDAVLVDKTGFGTFAISGNTNQSCQLIFSFDELTAAALSQQVNGAVCYLELDGETLNGNIVFNDDYTEMTFKGDYNYYEMCDLATAIRGL